MAFVDEHENIAVPAHFSLTHFEQCRTGHNSPCACQQAGYKNNMVH